MNRALGVVLPALAIVLLAAHFFRAGLLALALITLGIGALLFVRDRWASRALSVVLALGALEWFRTALVLAAHRRAIGEPYARMLAILGAVALVTALAAWLVGRRESDRSRRSRPV